MKLIFASKIQLLENYDLLINKTINFFDIKTLLVYNNLIKA